MDRPVSEFFELLRPCFTSRTKGVVLLVSSFSISPFSAAPHRCNTGVVQIESAFLTFLRVSVLFLLLCSFSSVFLFSLVAVQSLCVTAKRKGRRKAEEQTRKEGEHLD